MIFIEKSPGEGVVLKDYVPVFRGSTIDMAIFRKGPKQFYINESNYG